MKPYFNHLKWLFAVLIILGAQNCEHLHAQNYVLSNWTVEDGLSSDEGRGLIQDEDGFMWIATAHGLNKFDGYRFEKHRYHPTDENTIGANYINSFCKDDADNIWINLGLGEISKYDRLSRKFVSYIFEERQTFIRDIHYVKGFGICIATSKGLFTVSKDTDQLEFCKDTTGKITSDIYRIFSNNGQLFLTTEEGFEFYDPATKARGFMKETVRSDTVLFKTPMLKFYVDEENTIWTQSDKGGLFSSMDGIHYSKSFPANENNRTQNKEESFLLEDTDNTKWFLSNSQELFFYKNQSQSWKSFKTPTGGVQFMFKDKKGEIWICTQKNEIYRLVNGQWNFVLDIGKQLKSWEINKVLVDNKNGIWLSSRTKGIWRIYNRKWPITGLKNKTAHRPIDFQATTLFTDNESYMWVGSYGKLYKYYFESEELIKVSRNPKINKLLGTFRINDIAKSSNGNIWLGTSDGIVILKKDKDEDEHLRGILVDSSRVGFGYVRFIESDMADNKWIGTDMGLFLYVKERGQFINFRHQGNDEKSLSGNSIQCLSQINAHQFLIGYVKNGADLLTFNPDHNSISCEKISYVNSKLRDGEFMTVNTFYKSSRNYWMGTFSKGLLKLDLESRTTSPLSEKFPIIPNVKAIEEGAKGNLWISSIDGIRSVNPVDETFYRFTKASGLMSNRFYFNSAIQNKQGHLYFGSSNGLNIIQPANWEVEDSIATPILTEFKKFDERIATPILLNDLENIELNYKDDFITLEFVSPTYDNPGDVQYSYKLEGFDEQWRYCESQLSATYTNLPAGEYNFKVRAGNKGGFKNSKAKTLNIIVAPPFWQTSWFAGLMILLLILTYWLALKIQSRWRKNQLAIATAIRKKTADDFHDELGHRLTKIVLFVESLLLEKDSLPQKSQHLLKKIQDNANDLYYSTRDFIWAMNPSKDSALELFVLLRDFGDELFEDTGIQFSIEGLKEEYRKVILDTDWKRQLIMIFKEAMNNALKHSEAAEVILSIQEIDNKLKIVLKDNGKGFTLDHEKFGYGLGSMVNRSKKIGGELKINSENGVGTEVLINIAT